MTAQTLRRKLVEQIEAGHPDAAKVLLMQYEVELCQEQREICVSELEDEKDPEFWSYRVNNAPMPTL